MSNLDRANKGNIAVHKVCADLLTKNHHPFVQAGEFGLPVDVVVLTSSGKLLKLQVEYPFTRLYICPDDEYLIIMQFI